MLLADVPALSVGLLGFATLTSFMVLKKVKLSVFQEIHGEMPTHVHCSVQGSFSTSRLCPLRILFGCS